MNVKLLRTSQEVFELLPVLMSKPAWGVDSETTGLDPLRSKILMFQIGTQEEQHIIDTRTASLEPIRPFLESPQHKKIAHNMNFDWKMVKANYNIEIENSRDTFLAEKILYNGKRFSGYGLDDVLLQYLGITLPKDMRAAFGRGMIYGEYTDAMIKYAGDDVKYLMPLCLKQCEALAAQDLQYVWLLECDVLPCFCEMELEGHYLNTDGWRRNMAENQRKLEEMENYLAVLAAPYVPKNMFGELDINFASTEQVLELLQKMGATKTEQNRRTRVWERVPITDTSKKTLQKVEGNEFVQTLKQYRALKKRITDFGQTFIDAEHIKTGRIHPMYNQMGAETGRPTKASHGLFNPLNIPRDPAMRVCFHGAPDEVIETDDFSGCELRIWAELSQDPMLCDAFRRGVDVHSYAASRCFATEVSKKVKPHLRNAAKAVNFGIIYGMGVYTLVERINAEGFRDPDGAQMTIEAGQDLYDKYVEEFAVGIDFLREVGKAAVRDGYVSDLLGRRRYYRLPDPNDMEKFPRGRQDREYKSLLGRIERQGGNFVIQAMNAEMTKLAMVLIRQYARKNGVRTKFLNQVYDEIVTRTHRDDSPGFAPVKKQLMLEAAGRWLKSVPMEVEQNVGPTWTK
jgi:DNA polymerase-1